MSAKEFCESGKHSYSEGDVVASVFDMFAKKLGKLWIVVSCSKCDSEFLRLVERPIP